MKSRCRMLALFCVLLAIAWAPAALAGNPGDEVVVVYNKRVPESKSIADYYAQKRAVPAGQVLGFNLTESEQITRGEFRDELQKPLAEALANAKLWRIASQVIPATNNQPGRVEWRPRESRIRYLVLCYGVPLRIAHDPNHKEEGLEKLRPEMQRNGAAVDSELALLPLLEEHLPIAGPLRNPVYTTTNTATLHPTNGILMVARLDGPTPAIARRLVDRALDGERYGLWGRAYFDLRSTTEPGYRLGDDWLRNASEICRRLGFETVVDTNPATFSSAVPLSHIAFYAGWYDQDISGPFTRPEVEFMPGAFAYHLHSFSAHTLRSTNQSWAGPLLAKGAAITMGCVDEPYLAGTPDIGIFAARFLFNGFTFGEAAYACQPVLSWQTTVVGDPLYQPFRTDPDTLQRKMAADNSPLLAWCYLRLINLNLVNGKPLNDVVNALEQLPLTRTSAVLQEKLADLYEAQGKPASSLHALQSALQLNPSSQQKIRLHLLLAGKFSQASQPAEAFRQYETLLAQNPDYPDKIQIYKWMFPLAEKLGRTNDLEKLKELIHPPAVPEPAKKP